MSIQPYNSRERTLKAGCHRMGKSSLFFCVETGTINGREGDDIRKGQSMHHDQGGYKSTW